MWHLAAPVQLLLIHSRRPCTGDGQISQAQRFNRVVGHPDRQFAIIPGPQSPQYLHRSWPRPGPRHYLPMDGWEARRPTPAPLPPRPR